jgi:hypothetical protein
MSESGTEFAVALTAALEAVIVVLVFALEKRGAISRDELSTSLRELGASLNATVKNREVISVVLRQVATRIEGPRPDSLLRDLGEMLN